MTHMPLPGLRIRPNESLSKHLSIGDPPRPQIPPQKFKNRQKNENPKTGKPADCRRISPVNSRNSQVALTHDFCCFSTGTGSVSMCPWCRHHEHMSASDLTPDGKCYKMRTNYAGKKWPTTGLFTRLLGFSPDY